jgi:hypothetical protein
MPIYLLVPLQTTEPVWKDAKRREPIQVIAGNEHEARVAASSGFGATQAAVDPWLFAKWVYAHVIEEPDRTLPIVRCTARAH